jgi:FKBP-type peptidyl-prolyl cis-trans isomerase FklB
MNERNRLSSSLAAVVALACLSGLRAAENPPTTNSAPPITKDKFSYCIGANMAANLRREKAEVNLDEVMKGLKDVMNGTPAINDQDALNSIRAFLNENRKRLADENKARGEKYLEENKTKPGVVTLPSGLQYKVLAEGSGACPKSNDVVKVNYRGTLLDGTEFDSSYKRDKPATFAANRVIKGWGEALQLMKPGAKWQLFIPANLAYGDAGSPPNIGRGETLLFEVELLSFEPPPPPPTNSPPATVTSPAVRPATQPVTSDIIKVPSKEEMDKGAKIEVIKKEDLDRLQKEEQEKNAQKK